MDNHKINVAAMEILCKDAFGSRATHPINASKKAFLPFEESHTIKNMRSQFASKDFGAYGEISSTFLKDLYKIEQSSLSGSSRSSTSFRQTSER